MNRSIVGKVDELKVALITTDLLKRNITSFDIRPGNNCVWVSHGRCNCYYVFRDDKIVDVIYD